MELIYVNLKLPVDSNQLLDTLSKKLRMPSVRISNLKILRRSLDARKKPQFFFVYTVSFSLEMTAREIQNLIARYPELKVPISPPTELFNPTEKLIHPPVVVGSGPAGYFAALALARRGYRPLVFERGEDVDRRTIKVQEFWKSGMLDPESNVQFGEGGAGTFSDGKLTTRILDYRVGEVLETFISHGAPEEIRYLAKAHIGTDILRQVVQGIRQEIIQLGGKVHFSARVTGLSFHRGKIAGVQVQGEEVETQTVILAIGHSARDVYPWLKKHGLDLEQKGFAIGLRIEHPQSLINAAQFGVEQHALLGPADYQLTYQDNLTGRGAYTFCMCPGGYVVGAASEAMGVVTNGMSEYSRDSGLANSAVVVTVGGNDFSSSDPLAGVEFQRYWEHQAYLAGGRNYHAPAQQVGDFMERKVSWRFNSRPSYQPGLIPFDLHKVLPNEVGEVLARALLAFDRKIDGFAGDLSVLTGIETRTSSPVRIVRNDLGVSPRADGLYPAGEGAGYAGGIISAAVDGLRAAEKLMKRYAPGL